VISVGLFGKDGLMRYLGIVEKRHSGQIILAGYDGEKIANEDDQTAF
jgi:ABC-type transporter Mla maintaining outer membrane lipid asymmetry ATPase subunit MlaF